MDNNKYFDGLTDSDIKYLYGYLDKEKIDLTFNKDFFEDLIERISLKLKNRKDGRKEFNNSNQAVGRLSIPIIEQNSFNNNPSQIRKKDATRYDGYLRMIKESLQIIKRNISNNEPEEVISENITDNDNLLLEPKDELINKDKVVYRGLLTEKYNELIKGYDLTNQDRKYIANEMVQKIINEGYTEIEGSKYTVVKTLVKYISRDKNNKKALKEFERKR
ncbi:MAG: hypothetical protein NTX22_17005 [Ignavibacteriales bacterium]|nr:hypothetical protein [Ignavibacteriales bacterium]